MAEKPKTEKKTNIPKKHLDQLIELILQTSKAKGWHCYVAAKDDKNYRYATLSVSRGSYADEVTGNLELTSDNSVKISTHGTSFHKHGLTDLQDAIWNEICKLPWLEKPKAKPILASNSLTLIEVIERFLRRFHRVSKQLKNRHADRVGIEIQDEYDVQDILHSFLRGIFDDIRPEEVVPSYAGGTSRVDFLLKSEKIVIETKITSSKVRDRQIGEQLIIDIERYKTHPDCKRLVCFVYDPGGHLKNPPGLEADLSRVGENLEVKVIVVSP